MAEDTEVLRRLCFNLLLAPYTQASPFAITAACTYFEHPLTPRGERCVCGKVRVAKKETA